MDKVQRRKPSERKLMMLNKCFQPVASQKKVRSELSKTENDAYWGFVLDKYIIPQEGRDWVMRTICDLWRFHISCTKAMYYLSKDIDEDKIANKQDKIPLEEFKALLVYWADEHTQDVDAKNSTNHRNVTDTHTAGTTSFAQINHEMKLKNPEQVSPRKSRLFIETRKRDPKKSTRPILKQLKPKDDIEKIITSNGESDITDQLFCEAETSHGPTWLVGRHVKHSKKKEKNSTVYEDNFVQQLKLEIKE
ncbi:hypothetical protein OROMI_002820 [Orobanche minor]